MKTIARYSSLLLLILIGFSDANGKMVVGAVDTTARKCFLDLKVQVVSRKKAMSKATVSVFIDSSSAWVYKIDSDEKGLVEFRLPVQQFYTIKVSKPGYLTKIVTVDTKMPKSHLTTDFIFEVSVDMLEEVHGLDASILKNPATKIFYNSFTKQFDYDFNYIVLILKDMKAFYDNHRLLLKKQQEAPGK